MKKSIFANLITVTLAAPIVLGLLVVACVDHQPKARPAALEPDPAPVTDYACVESCVDMEAVVGYEATENGLLLRLEDGTGYYLELED